MEGNKHNFSWLVHTETFVKVVSVSPHQCLLQCRMTVVIEGDSDMKPASILITSDSEVKPLTFRGRGKEGRPLVQEEVSAAMEESRDGKLVGMRQLGQDGTWTELREAEPHRSNFPFQAVSDVLPTPSCCTRGSRVTSKPAGIQPTDL